MAENQTNASAIATVIYDKLIDAGLPGCRSLHPAILYLLILLSVVVGVCIFMLGWFVATWRVARDCRKLLHMQGMPQEKREEALMDFLDRYIYCGLLPNVGDGQPC